MIGSGAGLLLTVVCFELAHGSSLNMIVIQPAPALLGVLTLTQVERASLTCIQHYALESGENIIFTGKHCL